MKPTIENTLYVNELLSFYDRFLTDHQQAIMKDYFVYNLSLAEIATNRKISRTAVSYVIENSLKKLNICENNLHLVEIFKEFKKNKSENEIELLSNLERKIKDGI